MSKIVAITLRVMRTLTLRARSMGYRRVHAILTRSVRTTIISRPP
jgi:hypothetical protein